VAQVRLAYALARAGCLYCVVYSTVLLLWPIVVCFFAELIREICDRRSLFCAVIFASKRSLSMVEVVLMSCAERFVL